MSQQSTEMLSSLAGRLNHALEVSKVKASDLARAAGVDRGYISLLRSGKRLNPSPEIANAIANHLGCDVDWLLTGAGSATESSVVEPNADYVMRRTQDLWDRKFMDYAGAWLLYRAPAKILAACVDALSRDDLPVSDKLELLAVAKREIDARKKG